MFRLLVLLSSILVARASSFEERLKILENIVTKQQDEMDFLKRENTELKDRILELELDVSRLTNEEELHDRNLASNFNADINGNNNSTTISSTLDTTDGSGSSVLENKQNQVARESLSKRDLIESASVAFHVYLSSSRCFNDHQVIEYDTEVIDTGNGYNEHDGIYVVPESGMYVFTWTFLADYSQYALTEIVINGVAKGWTISDGSSQNLLLSPSSSLIIANVKTGDHVFIRCVEGRGCTSYSGKYMRPTFSGWQLSP